MAFSQDGKLLASGSMDKTVKIWDTKNWKLVHTLVGFAAGIQGLAFSPDNCMLAADAVNTVRFFNVKTKNLIQEFLDIGGAYGAIAFSSDGSSFAAESRARNGKSTILFNLSFDSLFHHALRAGNFEVVRMVAKEFPLLLYIRTPEGQSPLELAQELLAAEGNNCTSKLPKIADFLQEQLGVTPTLVQ